jgi:hypothetical protein
MIDEIFWKDLPVNPRKTYRVTLQRTTTHTGTIDISAYDEDMAIAIAECEAQRQIDGDPAHLPLIEWAPQRDYAEVEEVDFTQST